MPLDDHLGTDEDIRPVLRKFRQDLRVAVLVFRGIHVHPQHPGARKGFPGQLFDLLGARLHLADVAGAAHRAPRHLRGLITCLLYTSAPR